MIFYDLILLFYHFCHKILGLDSISFLQFYYLYNLELYS